MLSDLVELPELIPTESPDTSANKTSPVFGGGVTVSSLLHPEKNKTAVTNSMIAGSKNDCVLFIGLILFK